METSEMRCPHHGLALESDGRCPHERPHYPQAKRTGLRCPLCNGAKHSRQVAQEGLDFLCAWAQWATATTGKSAAPFTRDNLDLFNSWMLRQPETFAYGVAAQDALFAGMASAGTVLPAAVAADVTRRTKIEIPTAPDLTPAAAVPAEAPADPGPSSPVAESETLPTPEPSPEPSPNVDTTPSSPPDMTLGKAKETPAEKAERLARMAAALD